MDVEEREQQIKSLKLDFSDFVYSVVAVKVQKGEEKDILSELSIKETLKEALEKIANVYEFGMSDKEIFILGSNKKHDIGKITRTIDETAVLIERIFGSRIPVGSVEMRSLEMICRCYTNRRWGRWIITSSFRKKVISYYNDIMPLQEVEDDWNTQVEMIGKSLHTVRKKN